MTCCASSPRNARRFDLILVDPPYDVVESVAVRLATYLPALLAESGVVALESSSRIEPELPPLRAAHEPALRLCPRESVRGGGVSSSNPVTAICPGAYDPVTNGHLDVIRRTAEIFDRVVVGVVRDPQHKATMFTVEERVDFIHTALHATAVPRTWRSTCSPSWSSTSPGAGARRRWSRGCA